MREDVQFDADGVTLHAWLYTPDGSSGPAPAIVMAHGFSAVKEMYLAPGWTISLGGAVIVVSIAVITATLHLWTQAGDGGGSGPGRRGAHG